MSQSTPKSSSTCLYSQLLALIIVVLLLVFLADPIANDTALCDPGVFDVARFGEACFQ